MLVLTRKLMEKLFIGDEICVTVVRLEGGQVRLGIEAPRNVVHVLPYVVNRMKRDRARQAWTSGQEDLRVICDCEC